jgi:phosphoglycerol transferase MdoB-like AlkP superfamily enzyme
MTTHAPIHAPNPVLAPVKFAARALHRHAYGRVALIIAACMLPFSLARLALYLLYLEDFQGIGFWEVLSAFVVGLRFDLSVTIIGIFLPLIMMLLPFRWSHHVYWQRFWGWLVYVVLLLLALMLAGDTIYFGVVHRHIGSEIGAMSSDFAPMLALAFGQYGFILLLFALGAAFGALLWRRLLHPLPPAPQRVWPRLLGIVLLLLLFVSIGRGGWTGKPIGVGDAFFSNSVAQGYLALNGAFAVTHALKENAPLLRDFMPQSEAVIRTQRMLAGSSAPFENRNFPLYRQTRSGQQGKASGRDHKPNVVVLMLESWGALHIDALRRQMKLPPLGVTPNFDKLAQHGRLYTRFYAHGQRSIQGAEAILAGLPTLPGMPYLGNGIEQNRQSFLGELALSQGYATYFLQSSDRGSFRFDSISARAGFSTYRGAEDIAELHDIPKPKSTWGTWDHNTFQAAHQLFAAARKPFLGYIYTSTTHVPYLIPDARWRKFSGDSERDKYLNSLHYADWALGEFIAAAKQAGYYDDTIFVLTSDHANEFVEHVEDMPNLYHIPLLIAGPGVKPGIDERIGNQFDITPTIADLGGWTAGYAGLGRSLLDPARINERVSFSIRGNVFDLITSRGWISHDLSRRLGNAGGMTPAELEEMERNLLAEYQTINRLLVENRLVPQGKAAHAGK